MKETDWIKRAWLALLALDLVFIVLHVVFGWSVINLDEEGNLTAWYSSAKLLGLCALCLWIWRTEAAQSRRGAVLWLLVGLLFLALSADETASLHERLSRTIMTESTAGLDLRETLLGGDQAKDSYAWVILLSPFIVAVALFLAVFFYKRLARHRPSLLAAMAGLGLFVLAVLLEATIYFTPSLSEWGSADVMRYRLFLAIEESGELFGSTLFVLAFYLYRRYLGVPCPAGAADS